MVSLKHVLLGTCLLFSVTLAAQEAAIWSGVEDVMQKYDSHDADLFATAFTEDAVLINPLGMTLRGRDAIREGHRYHFASLPPTPDNYRNQVRDKAIEVLGKDLALVTFTNTSEVDGQPAQALTFSMLMKKVAGEWRVHAVQMTPVAQES